MNDLILYIAVAVAFAVSFYALKNIEISQALNITILALTMAALIWTTVDAKHNALEAQQANLRPVILRDGIIPNWEEFKKILKDETTQGTFFVANNVATNVNGYVVANGRKYPYSFAVSRKTDKPDQFTAQISEDSSVTWTLPNKPIIGLTYPNRFSESTESDGFYIFYSDISGKKYKTFEGSNFETISELISS